MFTGSLQRVSCTCSWRGVARRGVDAAVASLFHVFSELSPGGQRENNPPAFGDVFEMLLQMLPSFVRNWSSGDGVAVICHGCVFALSDSGARVFIADCDLTGALQPRTGREEFQAAANESVVPETGVSIMFASCRKELDGKVGNCTFLHSVRGSPSPL